MSDHRQGVPIPARPGPGRRLARVVITLAFLAIGGPALAVEGPALHWQKREGRDVVEVSGIPATTLQHLADWKPEDARWKALLRVALSEDGSAPAPARPSMLGEARVEGDQIRFRPRFPLEPGLTYVAVFDPEGLPGLDAEKRLVAAITLKAPELGPLATVDRIDPTADVLPENVLRFYLHFSRPMSQGHAYDHVQLLNDQGQPIDLPFLEIAEELWDRSGRRLTLLIDPGRIKSGLKPREVAGPVFESGHSYTLIVDRDWPDADGRPLREPARKSFRIGPPDESQPRPDSWTIHPPTSGSRDPLRIDLREPLDRPLAERLIWIEDNRGEPIAGDASLDKAGTGYQFRPSKPWRSGPYTIRVGSVLEDLAGNSIARPFEVDLFEVDRPSDRGKTVVRTFTIGP